MIRTELVRLYPNAVMKRVIDDLCNYRRYCWNQGLELWNDMYEESRIMNDKTKRPSTRKVRNELVRTKADWQYHYSSRCLQLAITDLDNAWQNFFDQTQPNWGKPKFKSKKSSRQGFKSDRAKIVNGKLLLDKPRGVNDWFPIKFKGARSLKGELKVVSIFKERNHYWAALPFDRQIKPLSKTSKVTAIDINVGHFNTPTEKINTFPKRLDFLYKRIKHYQKQLARKRRDNGKLATQSRNYQVMRTKLQRDYHRVASIQHDLIQKFTTQLVQNNQKIVIEDLAVKKMQMTHVASKGLQRALFGYFRHVLTYKCDWYGRTLILANRFYPSTQRCSKCGYVKTGDDKITLQGNQKHHTKHSEYICYKCGAVMDRDQNAVYNLLALIK